MRNNILRTFFKSTAGRKFNNPNALYVELTFDSPPILDIQRAQLLYDKKLALSFRFDDTNKLAYTNSMSTFLGGNSVPDENNVTHPGKRYSDNCGNQLPYVGDFALQMYLVGNGSGSIYLGNDDVTAAKDYGYGILPQGAYMSQTIDISNASSTEPYDVWYADCVEYMNECESRWNFKPLVGTSDYGREEWSNKLDVNDGVWKSPMMDAGCLYITTNNINKIISNVSYPVDLTNGMDLGAVTASDFDAGRPYPCLYTNKRIYDYSTVGDFPAVGEHNTIYHTDETDDEYRWDSGTTSYYVIYETFAGSSSITKTRQAITNAINAPNARALGMFTHDVNYDLDQNEFGGYYLPYWEEDLVDWIDTNYGANGTDEIIVVSMNTVAEYLYCREKSTINEYYEGNKVIIEIIPPTDQQLRRPSMTLKLNSNINITDISIVNIDRFSENVKNNTSGIINIEWSDEWYNTADRYVTIAESSRLQGDIDLADYFVEQVSNISRYNSLIARVNLIVVLADLPHLIDFSRNVSSYWSSLPYNDIHDFSSVTSIDNLVRDITGADNGIRLDFLTSHTAYYLTTTNPDGIHPWLVMKDGIAIDTSTGVDLSLRIHGLVAGKTYTLKVFGHRPYLSASQADVRIYNNNGYDTTLTHDCYNNITTTTDFANVPPYNNEIFLQMSSQSSSDVYLNALEIIEHNI